MTTRSATADFAALTRPSGGFAMLAVDQREALRAMFAERYGREVVADEELTAFKVETVRKLSPYASAVLLDRQFCLDAVLEANAIAPGCGLIVAADEFTGDEREHVASVRIDEAIVPGEMKAVGAVALKLLVLWRPDERPDERIAMTEDFVGRCRDAGLISIVEPVSRAPKNGASWSTEDWNAGVFAAARELGNRGQDLYKAEVPLHGEGDEDAVRRGCAELTEIIDSPWVVLSSGVPHERFPRAVELACAEGASGFLAGRAVWRQVVGEDDIAAGLETYAVPRLRELGEIVDAAMAER